MGWAFRKGRYFKKLSDIVKMIYLSEILSFYVYRNRTMPRLNTPFYTQHRMPAPTGAKSGNTITKAETEALTQRKREAKENRERAEADVRCSRGSRQ